MTRTIVVRADILPDRKLRIPVPEDVPVGPAEIVLTINPTREKSSGPKGTAIEMVNSPLFGIWADRGDMGDSVAYARQLRVQAERRTRG